jgi:predicted enzyme related to lactoylglutathione lyase
MIALRLAQVDLAVSSLEAGVEAYDGIFGFGPFVGRDPLGGDVACYLFDDFSFRLLGGSDTSSSPSPDGLVGLAFATEDLEALQRKFRRLALEPGEIAERAIFDSGGVARRRWLEFSLPPAATNGLGVAFQQILDPGCSSSPDLEAPVCGLDLVVISTAEPERATAFYGARLGLDMVLDRRSESGGRLMQFMAHDRMLEVAHNSHMTTPGGPDRLWGMSWKVADADAARARLAAAGCNVSAVKIGAKRGTRVFTLRDQSCGVPTLMMEQTSI